MVSVECYELSKVFHLNKDQEEFVLALSNVTMKIDEGTNVAIVGPSGSGKSTLLNLICGFIKPSKGKVFIDNQPLSEYNDKELAYFRSHVLGWLPQNPSVAVFPGKNVKFNLSFSLKLLGMSKREINRKVVKISKRLGINGLLRSNIDSLSGGELQRVVLASTLVKEPPLLLLDEPTGELDIHSAELTLETINNYQTESGATVIIVTHNKELITEKISHAHIVNLRSGSIVSSDLSAVAEQRKKCIISSDGFLTIPNTVLVNQGLEKCPLFLCYYDKEMWVATNKQLLPEKDLVVETYLQPGGVFYIPSYIREKVGKVRYMFCQEVRQGLMKFSKREVSGDE